MRYSERTFRRVMVEFDRRFVAIAAEKGFIRASDFWPVYRRELLYAEPSGSSKIAPQLLLEKRWMTYEQIEEVFGEMFRLEGDRVVMSTEKAVLRAMSAALRRAS